MKEKLNGEIDLQNELDREMTKEHGLIQIVEYARIGNTSGIMNLLKNGSNTLNYRDKSGATAVNVAAQRNDFETLQVLVKAGADLTIPDLDGRTPIKWAEKHKNVEMINFIIENITPSSPTCSV